MAVLDAAARVVKSMEQLEKGMCVACMRSTRRGVRQISRTALLLPASSPAL
jgi:hypothetical protein